jgi:2-polyprenyl-6-methoxyphenol hydroxylase-like FAD-dependent oxidoreductase
MSGAHRRHAEIAGGGVAGLVAAAALAQRGWSVRVHERADHMRAYGAAIFAWYNLMRVMKAVGAYDEAVAGGSPFVVRESRDARNRVINTIHASTDPADRIYSVSRRQMIQSLANAATRAGAEICVSSVGVAAEPGGVLVMEDGRRLSADLVIGADGVHSKVRDSLGLVRRRRPLRDGAIRVLIPRTEEERRSELGQKSIEYWSGKRRLFYSACSQDEVYLAFMLPVADREGSAVPVNHDTWIRSFPHLEDAIRRVGDEGRWDRFEHVVLHRWSSGRVAIVGDAANAMSPNTGQGAGTAAMNALSLAVFVSDAPTVEEGLARWEANERPLTEHTQMVAGIWGSFTTWPAMLRTPILYYGAKSKWLMKHRQRAAHHVPTGAEAFAPKAARG